MFGFQHFLMTWLISEAPPVLLMETGKYVLMETGDRILLEGNISQPLESVTYDGAALTYDDEFVTYGA